MIKDKDYIILSNREKLLLMKDLLLKITVGDEYNVSKDDSIILLQTIIKLIGKTNIFKHSKLTSSTVNKKKEYKRKCVEQHVIYTNCGGSKHCENRECDESKEDCKECIKYAVNNIKYKMDYNDLI